jgi:hypothetical protein
MPIRKNPAEREFDDSPESWHPTQLAASHRTAFRRPGTLELEVQQIPLGRLNRPRPSEGQAERFLPGRDSAKPTMPAPSKPNVEGSGTGGGGVGIGYGASA